MAVKRLPLEHESAWYYASMALTAFENELPFSQVKIARATGTRGRIGLASLEQYFRLPIARQLDRLDLVERYIAVLLAGSVGKLAYKRAEEGLNRVALGRHTTRMMFSAHQGQDRESDQALGIAFGWLVSKDEGKTNATMTRIWRQVYRDSLSNSRQRKLRSLASKLVEACCLSEDACREIVEFTEQESEAQNSG